MAKKIIRLTEGDLRNIIKASVKRILREQDETDYGDNYDLGDYDEDYDQYEYDEEAEKQLTQRYPEFVNAALEDPEKVFYYWTVDAGDETIYSSTCFESEDDAADDCDSKMGGDDFVGYVESLGAEEGKIFTDTMMYHEDGFWVD
jgi:hypothetical protein